MSYGITLFLDLDDCIHVMSFTTFLYPVHFLSSDRATDLVSFRFNFGETEYFIGDVVDLFLCHVMRCIRSEGLTFSDVKIN